MHFEVKKLKVYQCACMYVCHFPQVTYLSYGAHKINSIYCVVYWKYPLLPRNLGEKKSFKLKDHMTYI